MERSPAFVGYYTIVRKEFVNMLRIWTQTLLPPVITMSLYFAIFGTFIGSQVAPIQGQTYIQFIVPGLVMMAIITSAYMHTVFSFFFAKFMRTIEEILVSPMPTWAVIAGFVTGGVIRASIIGVLVIAVSLFFTRIPVFNVWVVLGAALLTALLFAFIGLINGVFAKTFDAVQIVPTFVLTPLTYLGGVFYSIDQLPEFFRTLSLFNPILYMVNAFRYGFLGVSDVSMTLAFSVMGGLLLVSFCVTLFLFIRGVGVKS